MQLCVGRKKRQPISNTLPITFSNTRRIAAELVRSIFDAPAALLKFPHRGRPGKKEGTRELVLSPLPYIVVYTLSDDLIHIARILHGAQQWP
jgi:toxin ParE1/3/4